MRAKPQRQPGEEVWRLPIPAGRAVLRAGRRSKVGGLDVLMLQDDEPLFSRRCVDEHGARRGAIVQAGLVQAG